jgi:putative aldouronate transport system substrate-binding protein
MRAVLSTFADWYQKGYIRKDFMSQDWDANRGDGVSGLFGIWQAGQWWGWVAGADIIRNQGPEAYFEAYTLPSPNGAPVIHPRPFGNYGYLVINKNCKNIDAVLKCMSFVTYIEWDAVEQKIMTLKDVEPYWLESAQGIHTFDYAFRINSPTAETEFYDLVQYAKRTGDTSGLSSAVVALKYEYGHDFAVTGNPDHIGDFLQTYSERCAYATNILVVRENRFITTYPRGIIPEEVAGYGSTLDDLLKEGFTKIIIGAEPLSYFDALVAQWRAAGGDIATAAMNRVYK